MIEGYIGRNGSGKTYSMVARALKLIGKVEFYTNLYVPWANHIESVSDMMYVENAVLLIDECQIWFNSRDFRKTSLDELKFFTQHRKQGLDIWYTCPSANQVDAQLRMLTATFWDCQRYANWIVCRGRDPEDIKRKHFATKIYKLNQKVMDAYDTYQIIGFKDGTGCDRGAGAQKLENTKIEQEIKGGYIREEDEFGRVFWRAANPSDVIEGRDIIHLSSNNQKYGDLWLNILDSVKNKDEVENKT